MGSEMCIRDREKGDEPIAGKKNEPMMPVVWTKTYKSDSGNVGRVLNTTMGASTDFVEPGLRRIVVNGVYWALGMEDLIAPGANIDFVVPYKPSRFGFHTDENAVHWAEKKMKPSDFALETAKP